MKTDIIIAILLLTFGIANAQKVASVESGGKLQICNLSSSNNISACRTIETSGIIAASISNNKIAIVNTSGNMQICSITSYNGTSNCRTIETSGVSNVKMPIDQRIIITYTNGKKSACSVTSYNSTSNCRTL
jgi:hypothetical protein